MLRLVFAAVLLIAACAGPSSADTENANAALVASVYAALARGEAEAVPAALASDVVWNEAENFLYADGNPYRGPDAVIAGVFMRLGTEWENFLATPERVIASGDMVVATGRYTGVYRATGARVDAQFAHVFTVKDGKVVAFQQYTDTAQFRAAARS